jgi:hypothetical protein
MVSDSHLISDRRTGTACRDLSIIVLCIGVFLFALNSVATSDTIPIPRERPQDKSFSPSETNVSPSPCQSRLTELAVFKPSAPITGPGECTATDVVTVEAVLLPDKHRVVLSPPATLRCTMAEAVAEWIAKDVAPSIAALGTSLSGIEILDSFECRPRNGVAGAPISEHGRANALDVRAFKLANGVVVELNSASVAKSLREGLRDSACARFSTVLGNGADAYHDTHVHIDLMERTNHYKICQWEILDPAETAALATKKATAATSAAAEIKGADDLPFPRPRPIVITDGVKLAPAKIHAEEQTVTVGPWTIATSYTGDKFGSCSMSRSANDLNLSFIRANDGLVLLLDLQKWRLERGKSYPVTLLAGSRSVDTHALADTRGVTIDLTDRHFNEALRTADVLDVRGEGATLRLPLDGSTAALSHLEACFVKSSQSSDPNPFVARGSDTNPFVASDRKRGSQVQYKERKAHSGVVKCYRTFLIGRYRCHDFY